MTCRASIWIKHKELFVRIFLIQNQDPGHYLSFRRSALLSPTYYFINYITNITLPPYILHVLSLFIILFLFALCCLCIYISHLLFKGAEVLSQKLSAILLNNLRAQKTFVCACIVTFISFPYCPCCILTPHTMSVILPN